MVKSPVLAHGDVDVVYTTTMKKVIQDIPSNSPVNVIRQESPPKASFMPSGSGSYAGIFPQRKPHKQHFATQMTFNQFVVAVQELAIRLYSHVIEKQTGTVLECLPQKQRSMAVRAALDVMMLEKIVPSAVKLGIILLIKHYANIY